MASSTAIERFRDAASSYLHDERFSDFSLVCEGKEFRVHRCFIAAHSKWFEVACGGMFKEASSQMVELHNDQLAVAERMISFFYTCDYDDGIEATTPVPKSRDRQPRSKLQMNAWVYAIAEKYEVASLETLAVEKFAKATAEAAHIFSVLMPATYTVYKLLQLPATDRTLKNTLVAMWMLGGNEVMPKKEEALHSFAAVVPEFMGDLTKALLNGGKGSVRQQCKQCGLVHEAAPGAVTLGAFRCARNGCFSTESKEDLTVTSTVTVTKLW